MKTQQDDTICDFERDHYQYLQLLSPELYNSLFLKLNMCSMLWLQVFKSFVVDIKSHNKLSTVGKRRDRIEQL